MRDHPVEVVTYDSVPDAFKAAMHAGTTAHTWTPVVCRTCGTECIITSKSLRRAHLHDLNLITLCPQHYHPR